MRLTLRTLLAYLDGNLEPDDAEDIGKKVEESEFASKLVHLIRDCTQRPRLGSPALMGRGLGADPNTVAEYLEYRLGDDRVPEFERISLESEVHLAEIASCHQILTLVLGEPAEIDPAARQRMYALASQADAPPQQFDSIRQAVAAPAAGPAEPAVDQATNGPATAHPVGRRPKPEVPDYLRDRRRPLWPVALLAIVAAGCTFAGLFFFGPAPFRERVTALVSATPSTPADSPSADTESAAETSGVAGDVPPAGEQGDLADPASAEGDSPETSLPMDPAQPAAPTDPYDLDGTGELDGNGAPPEASPAIPAGTLPSADQPDPSMPANPTLPTDPNMPAEGAGPTDGAGPAGEQAPALARPSSAMPLGPGATPAPLPPEPGIATAPGLAPRAPLPLVADPPEAMPPGGPADMPDETLPAEGAAPRIASANAGRPAAPPASEPAEGFGRYMSNRLLLRFDSGGSDWLRLPVQATLDKGQRLMSMPLFQTTITLSSNITLQADGPAEFELLGWDDSGIPVLSLHYGRLLMSTIGKTGNSIRLQIEGQDVVLTFVDLESTLAVEVQRTLAPGKNPESGLAPLQADVYATIGVIRVARENAPPVELQSPGIISLTSAAEPQSGNAEFPSWLVSGELSEADRSAANDIDSYISPDKPAGLQFRELCDPQHKLGRRREVRSLATRSLARLGDYDYSITAFNDPDMKRYWLPIRDELQAAMAISPENAARVRSALIKQRGDADGKALYRMLWGYNATDLQTGSDRDLVDALGRNDALDFRVLGILALQEMTGANHGYYADDKDYNRRNPLAQWRKRVGKITISPRATTPATKTRPTAPKGT